MRTFPWTHLDALYHEWLTQGIKTGSFQHPLSDGLTAKLVLVPGLTIEASTWFNYAKSPQLVFWPVLFYELIYRQSPIFSLVTKKLF